jgi:hypothetical protein
MRFTYSSGQRPLEGYTLKRGVGTGGFGEVYYAVSDGGKEVALKLVRGNQDVELRGVAQCLNLKHPNLVALFDMKSDNHGDHWVVMEYVSGESLSTVLSRHPNGLPTELAQQWFLALTRAVGYLHDHGIVHRDLKPGNIFLENGTLKVGDYGLSKFISGSQRSAQTQSVGTVHYMAPEISTGNYNKGIDIYAGGVILYEMLTGRVPFDGESAGEILMKHLTAPPDLSKVPKEFVAVVGKALCKNPAHRYATMGEMAKAVEGVGGRPAPAAPVAAVPVAAVPVAKAAPERAPMLTALPAYTFRDKLGELSGSMALTTLFAGLATLLWWKLSNASPEKTPEIASLFFLTVGTCWAILIPAKFWTSRRGSSWARRIVMMVFGLTVGISALWLDGRIGPTPGGETDSESSRLSELATFMPTSENMPQVAGYLGYFALAFFALRWWKITDRRRSQRFSFGPILAAAFWSFVLLLLWKEPERWHGPVALMMSAAIVQLVSPWEAPPPPASRKMRLRAV